MLPAVQGAPGGRPAGRSAPTICTRSASPCWPLRERHGPSDRLLFGAAETLLPPQRARPRLRAEPGKHSHLPLATHRAGRLLRPVRLYPHDGLADVPGTNQFIGATIISTYVCPSDNNHGLASCGLAVANYDASCGPSGQIDNGACSCQNNWNDFALASLTTIRTTMPGLSTATAHPARRATSATGFPTRSSSAKTAAIAAATLSGQCPTTSRLTATQYPINYDSCNDDPNADRLQTAVQLEHRLRLDVESSGRGPIPVRRRASSSSCSSRSTTGPTSI